MTEQEKKDQICPCRYDCSRHDHCTECIVFHRKIGTPVACMEALVAKNKPTGPGRTLTMADKPCLTDFAACAG